MKEQKNKFSFKLVWGIVMVVAYLGIAYVLVFSPLFKERSTIPEGIRIAIAIVFSAYGIYRGYRLWKQS
jgi:hypothetical protein